MAEKRYLSRRALWLNRLSEEVARRISDRISSGELKTGDALPGREALEAEFVTSGSVIDHAIETLLAEDLVERDPDGVLRVSPPRRHDMPEFPQPEDATRADVVAILELRVGVEAEAAALAAERRTEAQLAAIRKAQEAFEAAGAAGSGVAQADFEFHLTISEASGNPYLRDLTEHLGPLLIPRARMPLQRSGSGEDTALADARAEHQAIVEAIAASDADSARRAMRRHLTRTIALVRSSETLN
jgi:DNA-binding FadR family transcriptional regulator